MPTCDSLEYDEFPLHSVVDSVDSDSLIHKKLDLIANTHVETYKIFITKGKAYDRNLTCERTLNSMCRGSTERKSAFPSDHTW